MAQLMRAAVVALALGAVAALAAAPVQPESTAAVTVRGHDLTLRLSGARGGDPVIVTSGDGGWMHLGPHVAEVLAGRGFYVVGLDAKAYLSAFTTATSTVTEADVPGDYRIIIGFIARRTPKQPILVGVSEGAGLSVLAATRSDVKATVRGVVGIGLPDKNELGWRWRDSVIYLTHGVPDEPTFSTLTLIDRLAPTPLAVIHSTQDEFVPLTVAQALLARARDPKRLWVIKASDHRFSDNLAEFDARLLEAIAWVNSQSPAGRR